MPGTLKQSKRTSAFDNDKRSPFDNVRSHMETRGCRTPIAEEECDDLRMVVRRCDEVRSLGGGYGAVELSPYTASLLGISLPPYAPQLVARTPPAPRDAAAAPAPAVASR